MSTTIYARVSEESYAFVKSESERSGLPMAQVIEAFISQAIREGWRVGGRMITVDKT